MNAYKLPEHLGGHLVEVLHDSNDYVRVDVRTEQMAQQDPKLWMTIPRYLLERVAPPAPPEPVMWSTVLIDLDGTREDAGEIFRRYKQGWLQLTHPDVFWSWAELCQRGYTITHLVAAEVAR